MKHVLTLLLIPLKILLAVIAVVVLFFMFSLATFAFGGILQGFTVVITELVPRVTAIIFTDPWKLMAIPLTAGFSVMVYQTVLFLYRWLSNGTPASTLRPVIRGRQMGDSRGQQNLSRAARSAPKPPTQRTPPPSVPRRPA